MKLTLEVKLTPAQLAEAFCDLNDEDQAQFLIEAARIALAWRDGGYQWHLVGRHLQSCECSTDDARSLVKDIYDGIETPTPPATEKT